ncbi:MAG: hypothetical protein JNM58_11220 [Xanthomonadaceae bacterium]|nr:hypothetical protein [Xanthomonadaceae bacterium]
MSLPRLIVRMARYRLWLVAVPVLAGTLALAVNLIAAPRYTALARLLPPRTNTATAQSMLNQIGGTETIGASALTLKSPSELYASLFLSRSVQDSIIARFDLRRRHGESDMDALRQALAGLTHVDVREDGIIELRFEDADPQVASAIVNGMIDAVYLKAQELSRAESENRLAFYDQIIAETRGRLSEAETRLRALEAETGYTRLKGQEETTSLTIGDLESALLARETQLARMRATATDAHPSVQRILREIAALREKRRTIGGGAAQEKGTTTPDALILPVDRFPSLQARIEPARREVQIQKEVLEHLMKARQLSRIDEKRDLSNVQVLDRAVPPTRKSGPRILRNVPLATAIAAVLVLLVCLSWDTLYQNRRHRRMTWRLLRPFVTRRRPRTRSAT